MGNYIVAAAVVLIFESSIWGFNRVVSRAWLLGINLTHISFWLCKLEYLTLSELPSSSIKYNKTVFTLNEN